MKRESDPRLVHFWTSPLRSYVLHRYGLDGLSPVMHKAVDNNKLAALTQQERRMDLSVKIQVSSNLGRTRQDPAGITLQHLICDLIRQSRTSRHHDVHGENVPVEKSHFHCLRRYPSCFVLTELEEGKR